MKKFFALSLLLATISCIAQTPPGETLFRNVNVIPMTEEIILKNQDVLVRNGEIISIGNTGAVKYKKDARIVDATGKYLIPGLAEMHAHVPPVDDIEPMKEVLKLFLYNGVTTIRGMLGHPKHLELRAKIQSGEILGPHFYTTGPSINGMSVTSPEAGADMVRKQKAAGYDFLKLHPGLTRAKFDSIATAANKIGIPFAGHVSFGVGVWRAIEAGYSSIDHLDGFVEGLIPDLEKIPESEAGLFGMFIADKADRSRIPKLMTSLKENNIWVVPTQSLAERWFNPEFSADDFKKDPHRIYMDAVTAQQWISSKASLMNNPRYSEEKMKQLIQLRRDLILECEKHGVGLLLGCDAPQVFNVP